MEGGCPHSINGKVIHDAENTIPCGIAQRVSLAGLEMPVHPNWGLVLESRYSWADDDLDSADFPDFGRLNLGGPSVFVGGTFRF